MTTCKVCGAENDSFALKCTSCGGYLQPKVETLDLFRTMWGIVESPSATFRRIAMARSKNYVIILSAFMGIGLAYGVFWWKEAGKLWDSLPSVLGMGWVVGIPGGFVFVWLITGIVWLLGRPLGGRGGARNLHAAIAYASVPVLFSLVVVFPLEIALFGMYLFDHNPSPFVLRPVPFVTLAGIDVLAGVWYLLLLGIAVRVIHDTSVWKATGIVVMLIILVLGALWGTGQM